MGLYAACCACDVGDKKENVTVVNCVMCVVSRDVRKLPSCTEKPITNVSLLVSLSHDLLSS